MSTDGTAVEANVEGAAPQPKIEETSSQNTQEVDFIAELAKKDAEIAKLGQEKDNYRRGMLKAKGKIPDEDDNSSNDEDLDSKVARLVQEQLLATKEAQAIAEKDALIISLAKREKELSLALKNRGQITSTSADGSNQERPEGKVDNYFSNEQISALRAKGYDEKKIETLKKNMAKVNQMPK